MKGIHEQNYQAMIREREPTRRPIIGRLISKPAEKYKSQSFCDLDDEILRKRWVVQCEVKSLMEFQTL